VLPAQVFSFKLRGAFNKMAKLPKEALQRGVITSSAGNHAQGVALAASKLVSWHMTWTAAAFHSHVGSVLSGRMMPLCALAATQRRHCLVLQHQQQAPSQRLDQGRCTVHDLGCARPA
jgi:hypothetical protein